MSMMDRGKYAAEPSATDFWGRIQQLERKCENLERKCLEQQEMIDQMLTQKAGEKHGQEN